MSFKYPGTDEYALKDVSFNMIAGQLCVSALSAHYMTKLKMRQVIVGVNGSGKSTILKLIARLYDPEEGQILVDDKDVRTLKLADLRETLSVLFQDYTHFPLSVSDSFSCSSRLGTDDTSNTDQRQHRPR